MIKQTTGHRYLFLLHFCAKGIIGIYGPEKPGAINIDTP